MLIYIFNMTRIHFQAHTFTLTHVYTSTRFKRLQVIDGHLHKAWICTSTSWCLSRLCFHTCAHANTTGFSPFIHTTGFTHARRLYTPTGFTHSQRDVPNATRPHFYVSHVDTAPYILNDSICSHISLWVTLTFPKCAMEHSFWLLTCVSNMRQDVSQVSIMRQLFDLMRHPLDMMRQPFDIMRRLLDTRRHPVPV